MSDTYREQATAIIQRADLEPEDQIGILNDIAAALQAQGARMEALEQERDEYLINLTSKDSQIGALKQHLAACVARLTEVEGILSETQERFEQ